MNVRLPAFKKAMKDDSSSRNSESFICNQPRDDACIMEPQPALEEETINNSSTDITEAATSPANVIIAGGGIIGLLMALALNKYVNVKAEVYEQAEKFEEDVGAGMGLYANGLRVIRDIDPALLQEIQEAGHPYLYRRWERHDGTEVAVADEGVLGSNEDHPGGPLKTMGIRRWKLQQCLHAAVAKAGISIHFGKKVATVSTPENGTTEVVFTDGSRREAQLLIAADGGRSSVRSRMLDMNIQQLK